MAWKTTASLSLLTSLFVSGLNVCPTFAQSNESERAVQSAVRDARDRAVTSRASRDAGAEATTGPREPKKRLKAHKKSAVQGTKAVSKKKPKGSEIR